MSKNSIVYDNNIVNICFKVKAKKDNGQLRAERAENIRLRGGGTKVTVGVDSKFWGWGGDRSPWGGQPLDGGGSPPYWKTLCTVQGYRIGDRSPNEEAVCVSKIWTLMTEECPPCHILDNSGISFHVLHFY